MKRRDFIGALAAAAAAGASGASGAEPTPAEVMERNFFASKIKHLRTSSTMTLVTSRGETRERGNTTLVKLQPNGIDSTILVKFHAPTEIKGTGFLLVEHSDGEDDQWIYLPALKKSRRLVANNKKDSFVGSDFSYGDVSLPRVAAYQHAFLSSAPVGGTDCYVVESTPANESIRTNSGYARKISWIRKDNFIEAKVEYFDLGNRLLKTQTTSNYKLVESAPDRWFAQQREMLNHQTGHKTLLRFDDVEPGPVPPDDAFSIRSLERE